MTARVLPILTPEQREQVVCAAREFLGVRWRHQGRTRHGIDCAGLLVASFRAAGFEPMDVTGYGRIPYKSKLEEMLRANLGEPVPKAQMRAGDVVLMKWSGAPSHVGLVSDYPFGGFALIHAFLQNKCVVEHRIDVDWLDHIVEVYSP